MKCPSDRVYCDAHLWLERQGPREARIGITDFAQESLGEILYVDLPEIGGRLRQGISFGTVESGKVVSDLIAPASGTVVEVNAVLRSQPGLANSEPYEGGWMVRIELSDSSELDQLLQVAQYVQSCRR